MTLNKFDKKAAEENHKEQYELFLKDPEKYERQMREKIEKAISNAKLHHQINLRKLQRLIDIALDQYKNNRSKYDVGDTISYKGLENLKKKLQDTTQAIENGCGAKVLTFPSKK